MYVRMYVCMIPPGIETRAVAWQAITVRQATLISCGRTKRMWSNFEHVHNLRRRNVDLSKRSMYPVTTWYGRD